MKTKLLLIIFTVVLCFASTSCATYVRVKPRPHKEKKIPPGHVKKVTGRESAKYYAPGHNK